jgi:hypothetical protein
MTDGGVTGNRFNEQGSPQGRHCLQKFFDAAMLVSQLDLKMKDLLPMTLKSKMSWFNNASVYGAHGDLVYFLTLDLKKWIPSRNRLRRGCGFRETNGLEPGMTDGLTAELFVNFSLEEVCLWILRSQRRELGRGS